MNGLNGARSADFGIGYPRFARAGEERRGGGGRGGGQRERTASGSEGQKDKVWRIGLPMA